jgi:hypothetical protein
MDSVCNKLPGSRWLIFTKTILIKIDTIEKFDGLLKINKTGVIFHVQNATIVL